MNHLIKSLIGNYLRPFNNYRQSSFNINDVVLILIICKDMRKIETLFQKLKYQKLQTIQLKTHSKVPESYNYAAVIKNSK